MCCVSLKIKYLIATCILFRTMGTSTFLLMHCLAVLGKVVQGPVEKPAIMGRHYLSTKKKWTPFFPHIIKRMSINHQ